MPDYNSNEIVDILQVLVVSAEVTIVELQLCIIRNFLEEGITQMIV